MSHKKGKIAKRALRKSPVKNPRPHTEYSLATQCYCRESQYLGYTCDWCVSKIVEAKNQLVRENNRLFTKLETFQKLNEQGFDVEGEENFSEEK